LVHTKTTTGGFKIYQFTAGTGTVTVYWLTMHF
jgi:hypothetical protein